jgi:GT2 family glycosyltransferase
MVDLSICIVTLNACDYLQNCLRSIYEQSSFIVPADTISTKSLQASDQSSISPDKLSFELTIVDNGSADGTIEMLQREFSSIKLIQNGRNDGFAKPINQALSVSSGEYLLVLNPDTIVLPGALNELVSYLNSHPDVGICGPKVLNRDGSLQKACRRGVSRPWAAFSYFSGLSTLFPKSKRFGGYLLNYMDENATHEVDGVSGSCMLIRHKVLDQVGYFDERFFAYQEDADYCFQVKKAGWKIVYFPQAQIIHFGGQGGSRVQPYRSIYEWHRSYYLYYRKNLAKDYFFLFNWFYYLLMGLKFIVSLLANAVRTDKFAGPRRA